MKLGNAAAPSTPFPHGTGLLLAGHTRSAMRVWMVAWVSVVVLGLHGVGRGAETQESKVAPQLSAEVVLTYARIALAVYQDSLGKAEELQARIKQFLDQPSASTLTAARQAWIHARTPYLQSETFRFSDGPIEAREARINAWPIDENYIDYVAESPSAGVINQPETFPELTREVIEAINEKDGEKNISTGFHAIEFLLWGQDQSPDGPGNRSYRDYLVGSEASASNAGRRREFLRLVAELLVEDLRSVTKAWAEGDPANYRTELLAFPPHEVLVRVFRGVGAFASVEMGGERLTVPYETKEQEDEHSCFSDTTHLDVLYDLVGIQNVYLGRYVRSDGTRVEGPGLRDLLQAMDPTVAKELTAQIEAAVEAAKSIPAPFDRAIQGIEKSPSRVTIRATIQALLAQAEPFAKAVKLMLPPAQ